MKKIFVGLQLLVALAISANAVDYRVSKAEAWTIKNVFIDNKPTDKGVNEAIKILYGNITLIEGHISLKSRKDVGAQ